MKRRLFVLDPDLQSSVGHSFQASARVAEAGIAAGMTPYIFGNRHFSDAPVSILDGAVEIVPYFKAHAFDFSDISDGRIRLPASFDDEPALAEWELYLRHLMELDRKYDFCEADVIYAHTLSHPVAVGWLYLLLLKEPHRRPTIYSLIYAKPENIQGVKVGSISIISILNKAKMEGLLYRNLFFHTETVRLNELYKSHGFDFPVFMGPIPNDLFDSRRERQVGRSTITYLGEAREEKGFNLVPDIISTLKRTLPAAEFQALNFNIQVSCNAGNNTGVIRAARDKLDKLKQQNSNINLLEELTTDVYSDVLMHTDVALMPYDPIIYHTRGSGVAFEVLASGKVLVCSRDTDVSITFGADQTIVPMDYSADEFARAILFYLRMPEKRKDIFRRGTTAFEQYAVRTFFSSLENLHKASAAPRQTEASGARRRTALYAPIAQFNGGNGFVQRVHIDALRQLGYFVVIVASPWFFESQDWFRRNSFVSLMTKYLSDDPVFAGSVVLFPRLRDDAVARGFIEKWTSQKWECMSHRVQSAFFKNVVLETSVLSRVLGALKFDVFLGNYTFCVPFLQRLQRLAGAQAVPLVLETHDFHYVQNRLRRQARLKSTFNAEVDERLHSADKASEFDAAGKAQSLLHIASELQEQYSEATSARQMILRPYLVRTHGAQSDAVEVRDQADLFSLFGSKEGDVVSASKLHMLQMQNLDSIDLLFYGTSHPANLDSVRTFLETVFRPLLLPMNIRLFVAGDICDQLASNNIASDLVTAGLVILLGRVDRIETIISAAKVVALFVSEGTGFPTRVIEVLGSGQAFSVNSQALHELAEDARAYFPVCDTAEEMAADILSLLADREARTRRGEDGFAFYSEYFSERLYLEGFAAAIDHDGPVPESAEATPVHSETLFAEVTTDRLDAYFKPIEFKKRYNFDDTDIPRDNLIYNWSKSDGTHTWLDGVRGGILVRAEPDRPIQEIKIGGSVFAGIFDLRPVVSVLVNNRILFERPFVNRYEEIVIPIGPGLRPKSGRYMIEIRCSQSGRAPEDPRDLSLCLSFIEFSGARSPATADIHPILKENAVVFGKRGNADVFKLEGFSRNEELHCWTTEPRGVIAFQTPRPVAAMSVKAYVLPALIAAEAEFSIEVNGQELFAGRPDAAGAWEAAFDLRDLPRRPDGNYRVAFKVDKLGRAPGDMRELGWCLKRLDLEYA